MRLYLRDLLREYAALQTFQPFRSEEARCMNWDRMLAEFSAPHRRPSYVRLFCTHRPASRSVHPRTAPSRRSCTWQEAAQHNFSSMSAQWIAAAAYRYRSQRGMCGASVQCAGRRADKTEPAPPAGLIDDIQGCHCRLSDWLAGWLAG